MRRLAVALLLAACGDDAAMMVDASTTPDTPPDARVCLPAATYPFMISTGAFPPVDGHPNVIVYQPPNFDPTPPIDLVVYIHGFNNCIENVIRDSGQPCTTNGPVRQAHGLATQLDTSARNALLIVPEVAYDMASGAPGQLGMQDGLRDMLTETLLLLPAPLGPIDLASRGRVIVASHSGGYTVSSAFAAFGGVPVDEVWLLDSLYGYTARYDGWVMQDIPSISSGARRFADLYTQGGGTLTNSQAMATRAAGWVDASVLVDDRTTAAITDAQLQHGLVFKLASETHDGVAATYLERLLATSSLLPTCN